MKKLNLLILVTVITVTANSQQGVAINTNGAAPDSKSILDISSTDKGVLIPRMTAAQRIAIAPVSAQKGMLVFDTDSSAFIFWTGSAWQRINGSNNSGGSGYWANGGNNIYNNNNGNVGIATNNPKATFNVAENKTVLFGKDTSGAGAKLMWIPSKYAFRAGLVGKLQEANPTTLDTTIWNYDSIGLASFAGGFQNKASGLGSVALGVVNEASGVYAAAIGAGNFASDYASFSAGISNRSAGFGSFSLGNENSAEAAFSFATGFRNKSLAWYSAAIGNGNIANAAYSMVAGSNNDTIAGSSSINWVTTDPLFIVGNGYSQYVRKNAMIILKNGKTGFGTNAPDGLMHLKQNSTVTNPQLMLEEEGNDYARISFKNYNPGYWNLEGYSRPLLQENDLAKLNFYYSATGYIFSLRGNGNAVLTGTLYQNSDERLKKNISPIRNTLSKLMELNGYNYQWKDSARGNEEQIGLLAQEVEQQFPQLVSTDEKGIKSVAYSTMVPVLLQAIKEQQQQIEELKKLVQEKMK